MLSKCGGEMKSTQSTHGFGLIDAARISNFIHRNSATLGQRLSTTKQHTIPDELNYELIDMPQPKAGMKVGR